MFDLVFKHTIEMLLDRQYILPKYIKQLLKNPTDVFSDQYDGTIFVKKPVILPPLSQKVEKVQNRNSATNNHCKETNATNQTNQTDHTNHSDQTNHINQAIINKNNHENNRNARYKKVMIFFSAEKFGVKQLRVKVNKINELCIDHVIFILDTKFTSHGQRLLNKHVKLEEEIFYFNEMIINPVKHYLVPQYQLLTPNETKQFYKNVGKKIACVKVTERICRHFNGKIGQIFRIHRQNGPYFRIVVP